MPDAAFNEAINKEWMEALHVETGRLYYVRLEAIAIDGIEAVKPTGETSWTPPNGFLVRQELCKALTVAIAKSEDESAFIDKVKQRFPPPVEPPPHERERSEMRERIAQLEQANAELVQRAEAAEAASASGGGAEAAAAVAAAEPPKPSWKRGASARFTSSASFGALVEEPPPPPPWALSRKTSSGIGPYG